MYTFRVYHLDNPRIAYLGVEEGNINIESGIRFVVVFLDINKEIIDKKLLVIDGNDFSSLGDSGKDIRVAIMERVLEYTSCIYVKE
jgi:hypothetical protein